MCKEQACADKLITSGRQRFNFNTAKTNTHNKHFKLSHKVKHGDIRTRNSLTCQLICTFKRDIERRGFEN